jgi:MerR family mercuric resistance operon transcriptional regulator
MIDQSEKLLRIGRVASEANVGIDTIRFYERRGLLPEPQRTNSGYRLYPPDTVTRLRFILRAKELGFSLDEILSLLKLQDTGGPKAEVKAITHRKLKQIDIKIDALTRMRDVLHHLDGECSGTGDVRGRSLCAYSTVGNLWGPVVHRYAQSCRSQRTPLGINYLKQ